MLAHSQTEAGVERYFLFSVPSTTEGIFCPMIADGRILSL
nr:MAG TPA: hypothetical protein [Bacteriophage sp.]